MKKKLEYLRGELRNGTMSYGELLEAAGVPEFPEEEGGLL